MAFVLALILVHISTPSWAASPTPQIMINNQIVASNTSSQIINDTVMVPAKEFAEALGGSFSVSKSTLTATIKLAENELSLRLDDDIAKLNGKYIKISAPLSIINNRYMIPGEFTAKNLGMEVYMHKYKNVLMIFKPTNEKLAYNVMSGDTLWIISNTFGVSISTIKQLNNLTNDMIYVGQKLVIKDFPSVNTAIQAKASGNATIFKAAS